MPAKKNGEPAWVPGSPPLIRVPAIVSGTQERFARPLPAEAVKFPVSHASEKGMPLVRGKSENRPSGVPAVTDADAAIGEVCHLDAIAV